MLINLQQRWLNYLLGINMRTNALQWSEIAAEKVHCREMLIITNFSHKQHQVLCSKKFVLHLPRFRKLSE